MSNSRVGASIIGVELVMRDASDALMSSEGVMTINWAILSVTRAFPRIREAEPSEFTEVTVACAPRPRTSTISPVVIGRDGGGASSGSSFSLSAGRVTLNRSARWRDRLTRSCSRRTTDISRSWLARRWICRRLVRTSSASRCSSARVSSTRSSCASVIARTRLSRSRFAASASALYASAAASWPSISARSRCN